MARRCEFIGTRRNPLEPSVRRERQKISKSLARNLQYHDVFFAETGEQKVILTAMCGHGHPDLAAYEKYLSGDIVDFDLPQETIHAAMAEVPVVA